MVNGVNGIGGLSGIDATKLKDLIKEAVAEEMNTHQNESYKMMEQTDEETELQPEAKKQEEDKSSVLISILNKILDTFVAVFGGNNKEQNENKLDQVNTSNNAGKNSEDEKYKMSAGEEAYLKMNPDLVKNMIAEEKYQEQYGDKYNGKIGDSLKSYRVEKLARKVTDEEVQAYLQLNKNAIKDAMVADGIDASDPAVNETKKLNENEKAFMTLNPDYVKNLIAEEKYQEQYGDKYNGKIGDSLKSYRVEKLARKVTDEEVQAYLQLHPNAIKDAIAKN